MPLDELHARRLATAAKLLGAALDRMELVLRSVEDSNADGEASQITVEQARVARDRMATIRSRLEDALQHFSVQLQKPELKQMLAAELSTLWVILENARPERMKGYGRQFAPQDRVEWENLINAFLHDIEQIRGIVLKGNAKG